MSRANGGLVAVTFVLSLCLWVTGVNAESDSASAQTVPASALPASAAPNTPVVNPPVMPVVNPVKSPEVGAAMVTSNPLTVVLGLMFVVAVILLLAWLARRMANVPLLGGQSMRVLSTLSVGPRERVLVVDVAGKQFLLGVAPGRVNTLHAFDEALIDSTTTGNTEFSNKLKQFLQAGGRG